MESGICSDAQSHFAYKSKYWKFRKTVLPWKTLNQKQRFKMDKNEDLDLLEVQELALMQKTSKRQKTF